MKKFKNKGFILAVSVVVILSFALMLSAGYSNAKWKRLNEKLKKRGYTFTVGQTPVTDKSLNQICGLVEPPDWRDKGNFDGMETATRALPSSFDWRSSGKVTSVKNQGSCGSCWAFGTIACYESALLLNGQPSENLSEQFLLDCNSSGYSCSGGWWAFNDMYNGTPRESCYPYVAYKQSCQSGCTKYYPLQSWYYVGSSSGVPATSAIKQAIYDYGPVAAAVYATSAMQSYSGGVFNYCQSGTVNHAICIVGWDDGNSCWIVKNSWGTGWGESGYLRITYGCNQIGYAACYAIPSGGGGGGEDPYEPNDSYSAAYGPITSGENYTDAEIDTSSDEDWFKFSIEETGTITVSVSHESGEDLDWYLYHSSNPGTWLARGYTTNNPETGSYSATSTGTYYVQVVGYNGSTSTYTLNVTYPTGGGGGGSTWYRIMNRYRGTALDYNGTNYCYHFTWNGNQDKHWQFIDTSGGWQRINNRQSGYDLDTGSGNYVYLYTPNGNTDKEWNVIDLGTGYYRIDNRASGYSLDTSSSGNYVYHYTWNGNTDKQWQIIAVE